MSRDMVIKVQYGGLGDHLIHSHLPRLAKEQGYDRVLISNRSEYHNLRTRWLVWELNPYIDGFTNQDYSHPHFTDIPEGMNLLDAVAMFYGVLNGERFHEPEIYYTPRTISSLEHSIVFEPNHRNTHGVPTVEQTEQFFRDHGILPDFDMVVMKGEGYPSSRPKLNTVVLEDLCDIIHSCQRLYCYMSGVATLSAALGKPSTVMFVPGIHERFRHSRIHTYVELK